MLRVTPDKSFILHADLGIHRELHRIRPVQNKASALRIPFTPGLVDVLS